MNNWKRPVLVLFIFVLAVSLVACSGAGQQNTNSGNSGGAAQSSGSSDSPAPAGTAGTIDPLEKYDPMIEVTTMRSVADSTVYVNGETIDDNVWTKEEQEKTGVKVVNKWVVPSAQYEQKLNLAIASGDLADYFRVNGVQLKNLVEAGLIADLTDIIKDYSAPILTQTLAEDPYAIESATFDGKVMALPIPGSPAMSSRSIWVRKDWLDKLNLPEPKTMDDIFAISEAFTKNDPDGNGADDSFGLGLVGEIFGKSAFGNVATAEGFFSGYHAYPMIWVKDAAGKAAWGGIQPEVKTALAKLRDLYASGQIDPEFGVTDIGKITEMFATNKIGLFYGDWLMPYFPLQTGKTNNPEMDWRTYHLVSADDQTALSPGPFSTNGYFVVRKDAEHPEAPIKLANYLLHKYYVLNEVVANIGDYEGVPVYNYVSLWIEPPMKNVAVQQRIRQAIQTGDSSHLLEDDIKNYELQQKYTDEGDLTNWQHHGVFGENGSLQLVQEVADQDLMYHTLYTAAPTDTMVEKSAALEKLQLETFTKIIMGVEELDAGFDKFVRDWNSFGGEDITKEVNDWYAAR